MCLTRTQLRHCYKIKMVVKSNLLRVWAHWSRKSGQIVRGDPEWRDPISFGDFFTRISTVMWSSPLRQRCRYIIITYLSFSILVTGVFFLFQQKRSSLSQLDYAPHTPRASRVCEKSQFSLLPCDKMFLSKRNM